MGKVSKKEKKNQMNTTDTTKKISKTKMAKQDHSYELLYFDASGRAELIRILFHIGDIEFKDTRFQFSEWPEIKLNMPLGSVPVLKVDEKIMYCQSIALSRYAAKLAGDNWYPKDPLAAMKVDEFLDTMEELKAKIPSGKDKAPEELKKLRQEFQQTTIKKVFTLVEQRIQENGGLYITPFEESPTLADLELFNTSNMLKSGFMDHLDDSVMMNENEFPGIVATVNAIKENARVKSYYDSKN